ncbi:DUF4040 domain-containing protein [Planctobacterium marinum]|uniref:DUF4040 domain-containing protein n=1 Tax=Planctobacterium marinum TaxID=1631968 RepID=UPI002B4BD172|nr:DUF4040 domain-containing protein [Planctobacterium marinum]
MTALTIIALKDLFAIAMLSGIYGLLSASLFVVLDAVDVAFTEAAVGAGISTILMLTTLAITGRYELSRPSIRTRIGLLLVLVIGVLLIYGTLGMPYFGMPENPANGHVAAYYLENTEQQIGIPNYVTAVLASYRGFDTFGELVVVFTAGVAVLALLPHSRDGFVVDDMQPMKHHLILRITSKLLLPFILLFALYVQFHGDFGPGGGFQAGVIFAAAIILYSMLYGLENAMQVISFPVIRFCAALGVLLYGSVGIVSMLKGGNFLDYSVLLETPVAGQHLGILLIEFGVGLTVAAVMVCVFFTFTGSVVSPAKSARVVAARDGEKTQGAP